MNRATKLVAAVGVVAVLAASAVFAKGAADVEGAKGAEFKPGQGISFDLGGKHAVGYFSSNTEACELTVVLADMAGGETGQDSPGTRFSVAVPAGLAFKIDARANKSAEIVCSDDTRRMSARVYDRLPYKS
ncbi:MAG: hypothetical protein WC807_12570 [Hyphomicrobium sp.]|jgi:hypothetical protein